jgi:putative ABC transport system ATP-binding protein
VGFVFQAFHVLPHLDVAQNVGLPLLLLGRPDDGAGAAMLDAVGLAGLGARLPQSSAAASCSAWPLPARWCTAPPCCWPTSPPATWTRPRPRR